MVDDDDGFLGSTIALLEAAGWAPLGFESAQALIEANCWMSLSCVVADVHMPGMNGVELQEWIKRRDFPVPLVIVTGRADVPTAVRAMKAGAADFLEKPFEAEALLGVLEGIVGARAESDSELQRRQEIVARHELLTPRERNVFDAILDGLINKEIAYRLGISARTVEVHRARVMQKMGARNGAQLVEMALSARLGPSSKAPSDGKLIRSGRASRG